MTKKRTNLFEQYVDKFVLALAAIVSLGLLWLFVISNPYGVEYGARKLGPASLDAAIEQKAQRLQAKLQEPPTPAPPYKPKLPQIMAKIQDPLGPVVADLIIPVPGISEKAVVEDRKYRLPTLPALADVDIEAIRTVAYVPIDPLDPALPYDKAPVQFGDIDYVTVQASLDVAAIYRDFQRSFNSPMLRYPDPELAQPVFATVELQRRKRNEDGSWGPWTRVPPTRNNHLAEALVLPQDPENRIAVELKMRQFREFEVMRQILQPAPYDIASPTEAWLVPTLHEKYATLVQRERDAKLREERQQQMERLQQDRQMRSGTLNRRTPTRLTGRRPAEDRRNLRNPRTGLQQRGMRGGRQDPMMMEEYGYGRETLGVRTGPATRQEEKSEDVLADMAELMLQPDEDLSQRTEPLVIWAHDDSIDQPGFYQYRMRLGVFNPIVGKQWVAPDQAELDKQIVLYTPYTEPTEPVEIRARTYFFPTNLVAGTTEAVEVAVARYHLGRWRTNDFTVYPGQPIGHEVELQPERPTADNPLTGRGRGAVDPMMGREMLDMEGYGPGGTAPLGPEKVDFSTGAVLVDILPSVSWLTAGSALSRREIYEILYAKNPDNMERFPVSSRAWPASVRGLFDEIKRSEQQGPIQYVSRTHYRSKLQNALRERQTPRPGDMMYREGMMMEGRPPVGLGRY